jgi:rhodanese-related sulfurtransferase
MPNPYGAPEISVETVADKFKANEKFVLIDCREANELNYAKLPDDKFLLLPLSTLAEKQLEAIPEEIADKETPVVIMCHTGVRSAQVTAWMLHNGWTNVLSMAGGIAAYARLIDPDVGTY